MTVARVFLVGLTCVLVGCVSKPMEDKVHAPSLMIGQNSDGDVSILWDSQPNHTYTLYYQDPPSDEWKTLRTASRVPGTGAALTVRDRVNPNKPQRRYRLEFERLD